MPPAEAQGVDSANSLFYKKVRSNISHGFTYSILLSTRQTTIAVCRRSDWKPVGLPIRLKELRTFSCFPLSQHRGFYFPPPAKGWRSPFLSRTGNVLYAFLYYIDRLEVCGWWMDKECFYKKGHRVTSVCFPVFKT